MATTLTGPSASVNIRATLTNSASAPQAPVGSSLNHTPNINLVAGVAAGNVNCTISKAFTVTNGSPLVINVSSALDPIGNAAVMVHVIAVLVENDSVTTGQDFTVGGGTDPVMGTDQFTVQSNSTGQGGAGFVCNTSPGYVYNVSTANSVTITVAAGTAVPGRITILGCTA